MQMLPQLVVEALLGTGLPHTPFTPAQALSQPRPQEAFPEHPTQDLLAAVKAYYSLSNP